MSRKRGGLIGKGIVPDSRDASSKSASGIWNLNDVNDEIESLYPQVNVDPDVSGIVYERFNPITDVGEGQSAVNTGTGAANNHLGEFFLNTQSKVVWSGSASGDNDTIFTSTDFSYSVVEIGGDATNIASFGQSGGVNGAALYMNVDANLADDTEMTFKIKVTDKYGHSTISETYGLMLKAVVYTEATGGTIICVDDDNNVVACSHSSADEKIHKFTGSSAFVVQVGGTLPVTYLVVASGGSGGEGGNNSDGSGGGGGGGLRTSYALISGGDSVAENGFMVLDNTSYAVNIGASRPTNSFDGRDGISSNIKQGTTTLVTTVGGGRGGSGHNDQWNNSTAEAGGNGGSGGGAGKNDYPGDGTQDEGFGGGVYHGTGWGGNETNFGGGGGASEAGYQGQGGDGLKLDITGTDTWYAGGGAGGGSGEDSSWTNSGNGGAYGNNTTESPGSGFTENNGGGGRSATKSSKGIVIFRYKLPPS